MATNDEIEMLFRRNYPAMHRVAAMMLHDPDAAHDVVHDVFSSLLAENGQSLHRTDSGYLIRCVRNRCLNRIRSLDVHDRFRRFYLAEAEEYDEYEEWPGEELLAHIEDCVSRLSSQCAAVFRMRFHDGLSAREIAERTGTGERAVYKHLRHAFETIRINITDNGQA